MPFYLIFTFKHLFFHFQTTLQFELEELCAQNVDYQSTIHGEITYLTTGEYPTVNLRNRAMPIFTKVGQEEIQKLAERVKRSVPTPTSMRFKKNN